MQQSPGCSRSPAKLSASLNHNLNLYALAASATGVSLLALAQPSGAKIIYTKTHQVIGTKVIYPLDLNHDGTIDFLIQDLGTSAPRGTNGLWVKPAYGNGAELSHHFAAALKRGAPIGPRKRFANTRGSYGERMMLVFCDSTTGGCGTSGNWVNVKNRYLGLKFQVNGKSHYGWARLSVQLQGHKITTTLTGYAYETIPNMGLDAGQTEQTDVSDDDAANASSRSVETETSVAVEPSSLGRLALGSANVRPGGRP